MKIQLIKSEYVLKWTDFLISSFRLERVDTFCAEYKNSIGLGSTQVEAINNCWKAYNS